jgi:hypothetical protein
MTVAPATVAMRLSEALIIYLAAAAPFGVTYFLRRASGGGRGAAVARASGAALVWPAWLLLRLARGRAGGGGRRTKFDERRVERAKRETVNALRRLEDALVNAGAAAGEAERYTFFAARECAERYAGLALACGGARTDDAPTAREMELCRIAGRAGDDLLVAGRCFHRRNVTRLVAHRARARAELESALSAVGDAAREASARERASDEGHAAAAAAAWSEARAGAAKLFNALGDGEAAARLFGRGGADPAEPEAGAGVQLSGGAVKGDRSCTTQAAHTAFAKPPRSATTHTRG